MWDQIPEMEPTAVGNEITDSEPEERTSSHVKDQEEAMKDHFHPPTTRQRNLRALPSPQRSCRRKAMKPRRTIFCRPFKRDSVIYPVNKKYLLSRGSLSTILEESFTFVDNIPSSAEKYELTSSRAFKGESTHNPDTRVEDVQKLLNKMDL